MIVGTAAANAFIEIFIDGQYVGSTTADASGSFAFQVTIPLAPGVRTVTAFQTVNEVRSEISNENKIVISNLPVLDFDGDGETDPGAHTVQSDAVHFRYITSLDGQLKVSKVKGIYPAPSDYLGNGKTSPAAISIVGRSLRWNILDVDDGRVVSADFGNVGDKILAGCRFISSDRGSLAYLRRRTIYTKNLGSTTTVKFRLSNLDRGDVVGCGDTDGDGIDEVITKSYDAKRNVNQIVVYSVNGERAIYRRLAKQGSLIAIRRPESNEIPLLALTRNRAINEKATKVEALRGSFSYPLIPMQAMVDLTGGLFYNEQGVKVVGLLSRGNGAKSIVRRILEPGNITDTNVFAVRGRERLTRSVNIIGTKAQ